MYALIIALYFTLIYHFIHRKSDLALSIYNESLSLIKISFEKCCIDAAKTLGNS